MTQMSLTLRDPQSAHVALLKNAWPFIKNHTSAGTQLCMVIKAQEDDRTLRQNAYYWGVMLKEISEQARLGGQKYTADAWHELGKRQHLPRKVKKTAVAGRKKKVVTTSIASTTGLSVRAMGVYLEKFAAFAITELGVVFSVPKWQEFGGERVDMGTGEILEYV